MSPWTLNRLSKAIEHAAVIAYPSDTIWGFGCHPMQFDAVSRILHIKQRSQDKGLILLSSRIEYCVPYISNNLSSEQLEVLQQPGEQPTTWLTPAAATCPEWLRGKFPTIAIRITHHPFIESICNRIKAPLVSTSANLQGRPPVRNAFLSRLHFSQSLDFIVTGTEPGTNRPSEIKSLVTGCIIRGN